MNTEKEFRDHLNAARRVKAIVQDIDPCAQIYLFGSAVRGETTALSDIDILIVTEMVERRYDMMVKVYKALEEPLELHVANKAMLNRWYRRFIPTDELIEV
ncbi:MAG: nucleotidyltransferase domain-containing protein [Candidatus Bathyarchaeia archaeon]